MVSVEEPADLDEAEAEAVVVVEPPPQVVARVADRPGPRASADFFARHVVEPADGVEELGQITGRQGFEDGHGDRIGRTAGELRYSRRRVGILRWQWTLANRGAVTAIIDPAAGTETVAQDGHTLSAGPRGGRPEGHTVAVQPAKADGRSERPPIEAVITFDPQLPICILRVDGHEVTPTAWPVKERGEKPPPPGKPYVRYGVFGVLLLLSLVLVIRRLLAPAPPPPPDRSLAGTQRAMNGLFIAHYPPELEAKPAILPGASGILLEDKAQHLTIVLSATQADKDTSLDPWTLQQKLRDEALANVPKGIARFEETARREDTCLGERGAVVIGRLAHNKSLRGRVWSCAFVHDNAGYFLLYSLAEPTDAEAEAGARKIIDATELSHLADLGLPPDPSAFKPPPVSP